MVDDDVAAVVVQHPNVFGILEPVTELFTTAREGGAKAIQVFDPLSLGVLAPPGELGADIAVAEGQSLGNHLAFGGPYLGLIAVGCPTCGRCRAGSSARPWTWTGRRGYVLTLQAREQHIRREKANSNICTNQTLMAIAATIYLGWLGPDGLAELGRQCAAKASYAAERLAEVPGCLPAHPDAPFFKEFALRVPGDADGSSRAGGARLPGRRGLLRGGRGRAPRRRHRAEDAGADRRLRRRDGSGGGA